VSARIANTHAYLRYFICSSLTEYFLLARKYEIPAIIINPRAATLPKIYQKVSEKLIISHPKI
jgi:hypothetical protein